MADNLRIGVEVNVGELGKLADASKSVAQSANVMTTSFEGASTGAEKLAQQLLAAGLNAQEVASALKNNLSMSAAGAKAVVDSLTGSIERVGIESDVTTVKVDAFTRQLANSAIRIAASEAGMGQLGFAFGRLGAMSASLAPILAATFSVFAVIAFIEIIDKAYNWFVKVEGEVRKNQVAWGDFGISIAAEADKMALANLKTQDQIALLEGHPSPNRMKEQIIETRLATEELAKKLQDAAEKATEMLEKKGVGFWASLGSDQRSTGDIEKKLTKPLLDLEHAENERALAAAKHDAVAVASAEDRAEKIRASILKIIDSIRQEDEANKKKEIAIYKSQVLSPYTVAGINEEFRSRENILNMLELTFTKVKEINDEGLKAAELKGHKDEAADAKRLADELRRSSNAGIELFKAFERIQDKLDASARSAATLRTEMEAWWAKQQGNVDVELMGVKGLKMGWQEVAEARIRGEEEAFRVSQRNSENRIRDIKAEEAYRTAGLNKGPISNIMEVGSLKDQAAVATAAMQDAQSAANKYAAELDAVQKKMVGLNLDTAEGSDEFKKLERQMQQLQHQMDNAKAAAERWDTTLKGIKAHMKELESTMGFSMENIRVAMYNAAQAGFNSFNSSFIQMLHGAKSFTQVLQSLWTGMVESFISAILRMAEYYVMKYVVMIAITKIFGEVAGEAATSDIALKEVDRQAAIGAAAATAAIEAAWGGPGAAIAAAALTEAGLQAITSFEHGGVVKANLHEGEMVLPAHLSTFIQTAAAGVGAGPIAQGNKSQTNNIHLEMHNHGGSMAPKDVTTALKRALRQSSYSWG